MATPADATSPTPTLANRAYEILRHRLIMLDIGPGDPINEAALSAELEVGRTPIREALKRLERDHLVVSYPRRGTFATNVDLTDLATISEMREALEPIAARRAARSLTPERRRTSPQRSPTSRPSARPTSSARSWNATSRSIASSTAPVDNPHLSETLIRLDDLATRIWCLVIPGIPDLIGHIREHIDLLEAILDGDEESVAARAAEHVREFDKTVRSTLG